MTEILRISGLCVTAATARGELRLLDEICLDVRQGEVLGIVGESGSGKSMLALATMGLLAPGIRIVSGNIQFDGTDLNRLSRRALNRIRGARLSMIFQEPMTALNPMMRVGHQIGEAAAAHMEQSSALAKQSVLDALTEVGLTPADRIAELYPHQLSGGMRQRVMIAMAIICSPDLIIADEPTTALDVTVQAQILALLRSVVDRRGCTLILISHDIGVIGAMTDRVAVMYGGSLVEIGKTDAFLSAPTHPYSRLLLDTYVDIDLPRVARLPTISGTMPLADETVGGCRFHPRCPSTIDICRERRPEFLRIDDDRFASCHRVPEGPTKLLHEML